MPLFFKSRCPVKIRSGTLKPLLCKGSGAFQYGIDLNSVFIFYHCNVLLFNGFQPYGAYAIGADDNMSAGAGTVYFG